MTLTLAAVAENIRRLEPVWLVMVRENGHWTAGARIIEVCLNEAAAEHCAAQQKREHPNQNFGVFVLCSEAREVKKPIEIVKVQS